MYWLIVLIITLTCVISSANSLKLITFQSKIYTAICVGQPWASIAGIAEIKKLFGDPFVVSAVSMHERVDIAPVCIQIPSALAGLVKQIPHVQEEVAFHREGVQGTARQVHLGETGIGDRDR